MGEIALSNTINISLSGTPKGLGDYATNSVCILSNEKPLSSEAYIWAVSPQDIINEYGTDSETAKMGNALFTPSFNLRTGKGQVLVVPFDGVSATHCTAETVEIDTTKISALQQVKNGELNITIDGNEHKVTGLNFETVKTLVDVVKILNAENLDIDIAKTDDNKILFTSRRLGKDDSTIIFTAFTDGTGTDLYGADYLDLANAVKVEGANASGTTLAIAIAKAEQYGYFGAILTTLEMENEKVVDTAKSVQAQDHIYYEVTKSLKNMQVLGQEITQAGLNKTRLLAYSLDDEKVAIATYCTIASSTNYSGTDTSLTMNLKELTGVSPDNTLNQTYYNMAKTNGCDIYGVTQGLSCCYSFGANEYTDVVTGELWLKMALTVAGFNYLRKTNTKIPQTEAGLTGLKNAYIQVLEQGVRNGFIGTGNNWNGSYPFGTDSELFNDNIKKLGYYVYSIPMAEQSQTERENREAPLIQIAIKLAGAIHSSQVIVNVQP